MKLGLNLLNFGPGATPHHIKGWARFAEDHGFHALLISDHVGVTLDVQAQYPAPFYDPFTTLAWIAGFTQTIELGTTVAILPYRHPLNLARIVSNLDQLSGGRMILGVGVGWAKQEFEAFGIPFHRRGAIANEYLEVIRRYWANDSITYNGQTVFTAPAPVRKPHPPIWVGGSSDAAMRRAVLFGDAWHPIRIRMSWIKEALPRLQAIADCEGRPVPAFCPRIKVQLTDSELDEGERVAGTGSLEQIRRDLDELRVLGAQYVVLDTYHGNPETTAHPERDQSMISTIIA
jgi:probable F420-dependent oxidoreductase